METATLQLPKDLIEAAINQHVQVAIAQAMGGRASILEQAVKQVLTAKVDNEGKPSRGYGNDIEFIQWAVRDTLQKAVKETLNAEIANHKEAIRKSIVELLSRKNSPLIKQMAEVMTAGIVSAASSRWNLTVNLFEPNKD